MSHSALQPLAGLTILVTRPAGQGEALSAFIEDAGGQAVRCPLLEIVPSEGMSAAMDSLAQQDQWDWLIFVSANAVRCALDNGFVLQPQAKCRIAAIGEATAAAFTGAGVRVHFIAPPPHDSESLLSDPLFYQVQGQQVLIVRGLGGREQLADGLQARGAVTAYAELYQRIPVDPDRVMPLITPLIQGGYSAVVLTSGEALTHLSRLLGSATQAVMATTPVVVMGERLASLARQEGWHRVVASDRAGDESVMQVLKQLAHGMRTGQGPLALSSVLPGIPELASIQIEQTPPPVESFSRKVKEAVTVTEIVEDTPLTEPETDIQSVHEEPAVDTASNTPEPIESKKDQRKSGGKSWKGYLILLLIAGLAGGGWLGLQKLRGAIPAVNKILSTEDSSPESKNSGQPVESSVSRPQVQVQVQSPPVQTSTAQGSGTVQAEIAALNSQIATLQSRLATEDSKVERILDERGDQFSERLESTRNELTGLVHQVQRQLNNTHGDLLIADAEYLLNIANQKLRLVGDVKSVLAAMEAADQRLHDSGDPAVFKVREMLAEEMTALKKMNAPDVVGISAKLIALEKKVPGLPLVLPNAGALKEHEKKHAESSSAQPTAGEEGDALDAALREIKGLVTVRRVDLPVEAVLAPEQAEVLRQILLLKLEAARVALLRNDERLFLDSLTTAQEWLNEHFDVTSEGGGVIKVELGELLHSSLGANYPDIGRSMIMLQNIEKLRLDNEEAALKPKSKQAIEPAPVAPPIPVPAAAHTPETQPASVPANAPAGTKPTQETNRSVDTAPAPPSKEETGKAGGAVAPKGSEKAPESEKALGPRL